MAVLSILATIVSLAAASPFAPSPCRCVDAGAIMAEARRLPADVSVFAYVEDAVQIRQELAGRPVQKWIDAMVDGGAVGTAWSGMARSAGMSEVELFDTCFGRGFTFASRPGVDDESSEWVVSTTLGESPARDLLRRLKARVREPRFGLAISQLPEQRLLLASDGERIIIGPELQPRLFDDVIRRTVNAVQERDDQMCASLASDPDLRQRAPELLDGMDGARAAVFLRHDRPLGGCSMLVVDVRGDKVRLQHAGRFDNPLFPSPITRLTCDFSPVVEFEDKALVAVMQPQDVGDGPVETFVSAGLGEGLISPEMRKNLADRRLLVVGEQDARQLPEPSDMLTATFVAALELKDPSIAIGQLDDQMARLTRKIKSMTRGAMVAEPPNVRALRPCDARRVDLGEAGQWLAGGFPVMKTVSLNWAVAEGPHGAWFVVGTNPQALQDAVQTLEREETRPHERMRGRFDSCGVINGPRVGRHIENLTDQAHAFTDSENLKEVRDGLQMLGHLTAGMRGCRWQMARPTPNTLRLDVDITLAPAETLEPK